MSANIPTARLAWMYRLAAIALALAAGTAAAAAALEIREMPFKANDVVYDKVGGKLYVSVPGNSTAYPNSIVVINPSTGAVEASVWVGSEPNVLALSDDGQYLYVGLDGAGAVRRMHVPTLTPGLQFSVPGGSLSEVNCALDIAVMPGSPQTVAVVRRPLNSSGSHGIAIYDDGVQRPDATTEWYGPRTIAFGADGTRLYGGDGYSAWALTVTGTGVTVAREVEVPGCGGRMVYWAGLLACGNAILSSDTLEFAGRLPWNYIVSDFDLPGGAALSAAVPEFDGSAAYLVSWDLTTLRAHWWIKIAPTSSDGSPTRLVAYPAGAAIRISAGRLFLCDTRDAYPLMLSRSGPGWGTVSASPSDLRCGEDCARLLAAGTVVSLGATPATGSKFTGWEGDADCADGSVTLDRARSCVARFESLTTGLGVFVPLAANDIIYSPLTRLLYASVPGTDVLRGNTITAIDPLTGELGASMPVGGDPGPLAMSDDGGTLYVGLERMGSVRRVDLATQQALSRFSVGWSTYGDLLYAEDLAVVPGDPDSVAVVRREVCCSGDDGVGIYTNGVMRPLKLNTVYGPRSLAFSDSGSRLYGTDTHTTAATFFRMDVGAEGVTIASETRDLGGQPLHYAGGRIFDDRGRVFDPETSLMIGTFPMSDLISSHAVAPDLAAGVVYAAGTASSKLVVRKYDPARFTIKRSVTLPLETSVVGRVSVVGPDRIAIPTGRSSYEAAEGILLFTFDQPVEHTVLVGSSTPDAGVLIGVSPADAGGLGSAQTPFERTFPDGSAVTLTAPATSGGKVFYRWERSQWDYSSNPVFQTTLSQGLRLVARYRDPAPAVASVSPASGPVTGGTAITITGTGFLPGATVSFDSYYPAVDVSVVGPTTITARTPALSAGVHSVSVTNPDYQYGRLTAAFTAANLPGYFVKSSPAQATSGTPGVVALSWSAAPNASRYEYCLDSTVNGSCDGAWVSAPAATRAFVGPLTALVTYEWQVRAVSAGGTTEADGGWWTFTVAADPGCAPGTRTVPGKPATTQGLAGMWQPTGLSAVAGRTLSFLVGPGQTWMNGAAAWPADGNPADFAPGNNVPLTGAPRMALIGRVGASGAPFVVGSGYQAPAAQSGEVFLAPNDDWYALHDNAGSLAVTVCPGETPCTLDGTASVPATAAPGESAVFKASVTSTGCLNALTYAWDFGDGTPASAEPEPSHAYAFAGAFAWSVTIRSASEQLVLTGTVMAMEPGSCVPAMGTVQAKPAGGGLAGMWQATGVTVRAGDAITLGAGAGQSWTSGSASWTAAGNAADILQGSNCPLAGAPRMALIGRIGPSGTPFLVGQQRQLTAPAAGEIYLSPNDDWYMLWDNAGSLSVSICAGGATCSVDATAVVPQVGAAAAAVAFAATATATGCAGSPTYEWDFGDGSAHSTGQNPSHSYAAGTYSWTLTVTAGSATATRSGSISVTAEGGCVPTGKSVLAKPSGGGLAGMWQATGVTVRAGETLTVTATGQSWTNGGRTWTASGDAADLVFGQNCPLSGAPRMALVGRIGAAGAPFLVGAQKELTAAAGGELYLAPNDDWYLLWDNAGALSVGLCTGPAVCRVEATAAAPAIATAGEPVGFAGTGLATACAGAPHFEWDFGDGSPAGVEASPAHTYAAAGTYTWTLTVTADTATVTRSGTIQIREPGSCSTDTRTVLAKPAGSGLAGMWQATGITVAVGDVLEFEAAGGQTWVNGGLAYSADGNGADILEGQNCPLPGSARMALAGRIGASGAPFLIGQRRQVTATAAGQLYLAPNDDWYLMWDNAGSLAVSVCR